MNSCARLSGNFAGGRRTSLRRIGGLWTNHDFWNLIQSLGSRSFRRLRKGRERVMGWQVARELASGEASRRRDRRRRRSAVRSGWNGRRGPGGPGGGGGRGGRKRG